MLHPEIFKLIYTLYIQERFNERLYKMALKNLKNIDEKLKNIYKEQATVQTAQTPAEPFVDRSDLLFAQMNFIATYNKQMLKIA